MTRRTVYGAGLFVFLVASAMTLASIIIPRWITWERTTVAGRHITSSYGLHRQCSSLTGSCSHFPQYEDCHGSDRYFCSMWRSVGFLMSFAVVLEGMTLVAYVTVLLGGRQKRETGWKVLGFLLVLTGAVQCAGMAIMAFLYNTDERFIGWRLDSSWILCTISWSTLVISAVGVVSSAYILPSEGDYELIPSNE